MNKTITDVASYDYSATPISERSNQFGMRRFKPQNTSKFEQKRLQKIYTMYQTLYKTDKQIVEAQTDKKQKDNQTDENNVKLLRKQQKEMINAGLDQQRQEKKLAMEDSQILEMMNNVNIQQAFNENENLYMLHPRIMVTPDQVKREKEKKQQKQHASELQNQIDQRQENQKAKTVASQEHYQNEMEQLMKQTKQVLEARQQARKELALQTTQTQHNQIATHGLQQMCRKDQQQDYGEIVFGSLKDQTKKKLYTPDPYESRKQNIMAKQRENAEQKAADHILKPTRLYQYAPCELDPKPDMPLDHIQWGNPAMNYVPTSHYNQTFLNPKIKAQRIKQTIDNCKLGMIEDQLLEEIERVLGMDNFNSEQFDYTGGEDETRDGEQPSNQDDQADLITFDEINDEKQLIEGAQTQAESEQDDKIQDKQSGIYDLSQIDKKTVVSMRSSRSKGSVFTKNSKFQAPDTFETKSIRPNVSQKQSQCDKNLQKVTKEALDNFDLPLYKQRTAQTPSISSSTIKKKIKETFYQNVVKESPNQNQTFAQSKAQLDALKRFVESMEAEAIEQKRIAEERRSINQNIDQAHEKIKQRRIATTKMTDMYRQNQIYDKKIKTALQFADKNVHGIEGDEGYPPHHQPTNQEAQEEKQDRQNYLKANLLQQMLDNEITKLQISELNRQADINDQQGYGTVRNADQFLHTGGNMGKLGSLPQEEIDRKRIEMLKNKDIWQKSIKIAQAKKELQEKQNILVNEDKLVMVIKQKKQELNHIIKDMETCPLENSAISEVTKSDSQVRAQNMNQSQRLKSQGQLNRLHQNVVQVNDNQLFHKRANSLLKDTPTMQFTKSHPSSFQKTLPIQPENLKSKTTLKLFELLSQKIEPIITDRKMLTPHAHVVKPKTSHNSNLDARSTWSKLMIGISYDGQNRIERLDSQIDRKRIVETEHRYRRGQHRQDKIVNIQSRHRQDNQKDTSAVNQSELSEKAEEIEKEEENEVFPWEKRSKYDWKQYRSQIAKKPHHEHRHELLI